MRYGTVNSDGSGEETVRRDICSREGVSDHGRTQVNGTVFQDTVSLDNTDFSVPLQSLGVTTSVSPGPRPPFPHDGLMGFFIPGSAFGEEVPNWFSSLCRQPSILDECRFGLALEPSTESAFLYLGGVEQSRYAGALSTAAMHERYVFGDVAVGGRIIHRDAAIMIDSGTTVSWG